MLSIVHHGPLPDTTFGCVKDSGYGPDEGGSESMEAYRMTKFWSGHR